MNIGGVPSMVTGRFAKPRLACKCYGGSNPLASANCLHRLDGKGFRTRNAGNSVRSRVQAHVNNDI